MSDPTEGERREVRAYSIDHTPWGIAEGEEIELSLRESDDGRHTRRVLRWHSGVKEGERRLSISLVHQRRAPLTGDWRDEHFDLRQLTAGQEVTLELDAEQTAKLIEHLDILRKINEKLRTEHAPSYEVRRRGEVAVAPEFATLLEQLLGTSDPATVAQNLAVIAPDLAGSAGIIHQYRIRADALAEFRYHFDALDWAERDWQRSFEANPWIFGHGLDYRFLVTEQAQAHYGGGDVTGRGGEEGDFLMATEGDARFSVLVEIKKPDTDLLDDVRYRNGAWRPSKELAGGVAQLQANCQQWQVSSRQLPNSEWASEREITTASPEGILLIGRLATITEDREKEESFERFRRQLWNPRVLTYDELYARAEFIVARNAEEAAQAHATAQPAPPVAASVHDAWVADDDEDLDDLPF